MHSLSYLDEFEGDIPPRRIWNLMIREVARRLPRVLDFPVGLPAEPSYPFRVTYQPWADAPPAYPGNPALLYQVNVQSAFMNDQPVTATYSQQGDPRGWVMPTDYLQSQPGAANDSPTTVDRPLYEPDDPPFLVLQAPPPGQLPAQWTDFRAVPNAIRPPFFQTADLAPLTLMVASVYVTADTGNAQLYAPIAAALTRFRIFAGAQVPIATQGQSGGSIEIARVYLTRTPDNNPANDAIYDPEQFIFTDLNAIVSVAPGAAPFQFWST